MEHHATLISASAQAGAASEPGSIGIGRTALQRRAPAAVRRHGLYAFRRVVVLLSADMALFLVLRLAAVAIRDAASFGSVAAGVANVLFPVGLIQTAHLVAGLMIGLLVTGNYGASDRRRNPMDLLKGCALGAALAYWGPFWLQGGAILPSYAAVTGIYWVLLTTQRMVIDEVVVRMRRRSGHYLRALLIGTPTECVAVARSGMFSPRSAYQVVGFVSTANPPGRVVGVVGRADQLDLLIQQHAADTLVLCGDLVPEQVEALTELASLSGCELLCMPGALRKAGLRPAMRWHRNEPIIALTAPSRRARQLLFKRALDILISSVALLALSPLLLLIAFAVKVTSPGTILFRQERVGRAGRRFTIYKFRTMVTGAESQVEELRLKSLYSDHRLFKVQNDPRVTPVGAVLRRTSLDEVPQLWNVLIGDMSLVGARPPVPAEVALYEEMHYCRFDVKPGITGPWQVAGRNQITDFDEVVRLERDYVRNWSLFLDFRIMLRTIPVVLSMRGAH